jgi:hypothetical protein
MRMTAEGTVVDGQRMTLDELSRLRVVPHQNHHLKNLGAAAEAIFEHLKQRPLSVLEIDEPLFYTGDEPVLIIGAGADPTHMPECFLSNRERKRRHRAARVRDGAQHLGEHPERARPKNHPLLFAVLRQAPVEELPPLLAPVAAPVSSVAVGAEAVEGAEDVERVRGGHPESLPFVEKGACLLVLRLLWGFMMVIGNG